MSGRGGCARWSDYAALDTSKLRGDTVAVHPASSTSCPRPLMCRPSLIQSVVLCSAVIVMAACHSSSTQTPKPDAGAAAKAAVPAKPAAVTAANVALGDSLFNTGSCQNCHGKLGVGAANAPALNGKKWLHLKTGSFEEIVGIVTTGVPLTAVKDSTHKHAMNPRGGRANLTDPQITAVAAYVYTLTHK